MSNEKMREAFEAWVLEHSRRPGTHVTRAKNGKYLDNRVASKWPAWQAALAQQPVNAELLQVVRATLEWIDDVPTDTPLPAMRGFDRDWADSVIDRAALAQQSEPAQVSQEPAMWIAPSGEGFRISLGTKKPEHAELWEAVYLAPPDYEALKAENARLLSERDSMAKELTDKVDYWYDETQTLKLRITEWQRMYETNRETIDKLQSELDRYKNRETAGLKFMNKID